MTSRNSSSASFISGQRELLSRRMWPFALSLLLFSLQHVAGTFLVLSSSRTTMEESGLYTAQEIARELQASTSLLLGLRSLSSFITLVLAVVLAVQGYAWLMNRQELDFYESQPVSRRSHFFSVWVNNLLIYLISYLSTMLLAHLVAAGLGARTEMSGTVFAESMVQALRSLLLFMGLQAVTMLAVMLTGNIVISLLAAAVLMLYEFFFRLLVEGLREEFYRTFVTPDILEFMPVFSPLRWYLEGTGKAADLMQEAGYLGDAFSEPGILGRAISLILPCEAANLLLTAGLMAAVYFCYHIRKSESAGSAVIFRPVRGIVRIAIAVLLALFTGSVLYNINSQVKSYGTAAAIIGIIIMAVIMACIMQIIYEFNFKALFRHPWEIALAAILGVLIFCLFRFDLTGYDRRVPSPSSVESCSLSISDWFNQYYDEKGQNLNPEEYIREHMVLTDTESVIALAEAGIEELQLDPDGRNPDPWMQIQFRMKNGKMVQRTFPVPAGSPEILDRVLSSEEYLRGQYPLCGEDYFAGHKKSLTYLYDTGWVQMESSEDLYDEFRDAYRKDLARYSYSLAHEEFSIGTFTLEQRNQTGYVRASQNYEIYPSYEATISFLKTHDLWAEPTPPEGAVSLITLWDNEAWEKAEGNPPESDIRISDPDRIQAILEASVPGPVRSAWHTADQYDRRYDVTVHISQDYLESFRKEHPSVRTFTEDGGETARRFLAGKVPAFLD